MNHAATAHLEPTVAFAAERFRFFDEKFNRRFGEGEIARLGFDVEILAILGLEKVLPNAEEVAHGGIF